ncbi:MAG: cation diffusion facilitator family transporter [Cyanobacteria bacterium J06638_22]
MIQQARNSMVMLHKQCDPRTCPVKADGGTKRRSLALALVLLLGFAAVEFAMSLASHSIALSAEAGHLLSDGGALGVALLASFLAQRPASDKAPFGYGRMEILAALVQGIGLVAIALWIASEAWERLQMPSTDILGLPMLVTAVAGFVVSSLNARLLHDHSHHDLNLRGAFLHMVADALSAVGVMLAAAAVWWLHWNWADGAISLVVAVFILVGAIPLLRESLEILLERTPRTVDVAEVRSHLLALPSVIKVENLRIWAVAPGCLSLMVHLQVAEMEAEARDRLLQVLQASLRDRFGITDSCLQLSAVPTAVGTTPINLSQPPSLEILTLTSSASDEQSYSDFSLNQP